MKVSLNKVEFYINSAEAVLLIDNDRQIVRHRMAPLTGEKDNQWLYIAWANKHEDYSIKFIEENNREIEVSEERIFTLIDEEGDEFRFKLVKEWEFNLAVLANSIC